MVSNQEVEIFEVEFTKYQIFVKSFKNVISSKLKDKGENLHYLLQYTNGKPRVLIETCLLMETNKGDKEARKLYCNLAVIATAYINKILNWEEVQIGHMEGLDEFTIWLLLLPNL